MNIQNETPMTLAEVKKELDKIKKKEKELNFRAAKTEDYLNQFTRISEAKQKELYKDLEKLKITRLKQQHMAKLADILPTRPQDIKVVLQGYNITLSADQLKKLTSTLAKYSEA